MSDRVVADNASPYPVNMQRPGHCVRSSSANALKSSLSRATTTQSGHSNPCLEHEGVHISSPCSIPCSTSESSFVAGGSGCEVQGQGESVLLPLLLLHPVTGIFLNDRIAEVHDQLSKEKPPQGLLLQGNGSHSGRIVRSLPSKSLSPESVETACLALYSD